MTNATHDNLQMLLSEATPGPWTWRRSSINRNIGIICDDGGGCLAECFDKIRHIGERASMEQEANAKLISAAPDLASEVLRLRARVEELEDGLERYLYGMVDYRPVEEPYSDVGRSQYDKCPHNREMWEDCEDCVDVYLQKLLDPNWSEDDE